MPERYIRMRDKMIADGVPEQEAKRIAAATYNKHRKRGEKPLSRDSHDDADKKHPVKRG